jgi:hypothetical protein
MSGTAAPVTPWRTASHADKHMDEVTDRVAQLSCKAPETPSMKVARHVIAEAEEIERNQGSESALVFITAAKANTPGVAFKPVLECGSDPARTLGNGIAMWSAECDSAHSGS